MTQKLYILGLLIFIYSYPCKSQERERLPKKYIAYKTIDSIKIDGLAEELSWKNIEKTDWFIDIEGEKTPKYKTSVKITYNKEYIFFYANMEEPHVWGDIKKKDAIIYYNNDFEIFIDPDGDSHNYYEIEVNALNTIWDLFISKPYRESNIVLNDWDAKGMLSAVHINGTLNNSNDIDKGWSVEIAIPLDVFKIAYFEKITLEKDFWRINFSRVNWDFEIEDTKYSRKKDNNNKYLPEYNWVWSSQYEIAMHKPELWGYVYFSEKDAGEKDTFKIPLDETLKQYLYKLYLKQKSFFKRNKKWAKELKDINIKEIEIKNKIIIPKLESYSKGFIFYIKSPFTNKEYFINEEGKLTTKK